MAGRKGRSGRPRLPSAVKKARGTYIPSRAAKNEVSFPVARLQAPDWLDERAQEEWDRVVPLLDSVKVLTEPDLLALANYCSCASVAINATIKYQKEGLIKPAAKGSLFGPKVNPMIKVAQEARAQCLRFQIEFGLTPAARSRIVGQPPADPTKSPKGDDAEEFLFSHPPKLVVVPNKKG